MNDHIRSWLRSPPRFVATIEIQSDALKNYVYRQIFNGNGDPPTPLTQSEASKEIRVGNTITTKGVARAKELETLEILVEAVSEEGPNSGDSVLLPILNFKTQMPHMLSSQSVPPFDKDGF